MNAELHDIAIKIFDFCHQYNVRPSVHWIPREQNKIADSLSRIRDWDDWAITQAFCQKVVSWLNMPVTVDLFATAQNRKFTKFFFEILVPRNFGSGRVGAKLGQRDRLGVPSSTFGARNVA